MSGSNDDEDLLKVPAPVPVLEHVPTSAEILRLLASDDDDEPLTGGTMEKAMKQIKASVCCIDIKEFIMIAKRKPQTSTSTSHNGNAIPIICDARSPGEFALGHIPGATNLPIFTNEERAIVGTMYNKEGRSSAMVKGMSIVRPKLDTLVLTAVSIVANSNVNKRAGAEAEAHTQSSTINEHNNGDEGESDDTSNNSNNVLLLHCWRGGMRSCSLAFLIQTQCPDLKVYVLTGGYRAFRKWQYSLYCYLPPNADYSEHHSHQQHRGAGKKQMSQKQKLKAALRKSTAKGIGAAKRNAHIEKALARERERERCGVGQYDQDKINAAHVDKDKEAAAEAEAERKAESEWADVFDRGPRIIIIGGPTGSGKTKVLHALRDVLGEQIIDLEGLANHSGSAFGFVGHHEPQPTTQQYTNNIAMEWNSLDPDRPMFIEDEGHHVGRVSLPVGLYRKMRTASMVLKLDIPKEIRIEALREDYALPEKKKNMEDNDSCNDDSTCTDKDISEWLSNMMEATKSLERRVGQKRINTMLKMLQGGHFADFAREALEYYDGLYDKHITNEDGSADMKGNGSRAATISTISIDNMEKFDAVAVARQVIATYNDLI